MERLKEIEADKEGNIILLAEIAGFLIDIGSEYMDDEAAEAGVYIMENNRALLTDD